MNMYYVLHLMLQKSGHNGLGKKAPVPKWNVSLDKK